MDGNPAAAHLADTQAEVKEIIYEMHLDSDYF